MEEIEKPEATQETEEVEEWFPSWAPHCAGDPYYQPDFS